VEIHISPVFSEHLAPARELLGQACAFDDAARVAEEKLFGDGADGRAAAVLGAWDRDALVGLAVVDGRFLRVFAVAPAGRGRGVGGRLLDAACAHARSDGQTRLSVGGGAGNYLAPGIDERDAGTRTWFERRGFARVGGAENLDVPLVDNPLVSGTRAAELAHALGALGYQVRRAQPVDGPELTRLAASFSPGWAWQVARAQEAVPADVHVAAHQGRPVAFAAHDGNNRGLGWFGPAGTLDAHRGRGLGRALLIACLVDIAAAGHDKAEIAWIGPREFYARSCGAVDGRRFVRLERSLEAA